MAKIKDITNTQAKWIGGFHLAIWHGLATTLMKLKIMRVREMSAIDQVISTRVQTFVSQRAEFNYAQYAKHDSKQTFKLIKSIKPTKARS